MIDFAPLLKIIPIAAAGMIVPGPDFMMISSMALSRGRKAGLMAAAGIALGVLVYTMLCTFGLGIVFAQMQWLITAIRICGGVYLVYLGVQLWRASLKKDSCKTDEGATYPLEKKNPFLVGFVTNMTNPKALAFFTSIFAVALPPEANASTQAAIIFITSIMPIFWFGFVTFGLSTPAMRKVYLRGSRWIDRVAGTFLTFFGLKLMFSRNN